MPDVPGQMTLTSPPAHWPLIEDWDQLRELLLARALLERMTPVRQTAEALGCSGRLIARIAYAGIIPSQKLPVWTGRYTQTILHVDIKAARLFLEKPRDERRQIYRDLRRGSGGDLFYLRQP